MKRMGTIAIAVYIAATCQVLHSQDFERIRNRCRLLKVQDTNTEQVTVLTRLLPFDLSTVRTPITNSTLNETIGLSDLTSVAVSMAVWKKQFPEENKAAKNPYVQRASADSILIVRGREVLIFPRILMVHPGISGLQLKSGDFVGSFFLIEDLPKKDSIKKFVDLKIKAESGTNSDENVAVTFIDANKIAETKRFNTRLKGSLYSKTTWDYQSFKKSLQPGNPDVVTARELVRSTELWKSFSVVNRVQRNIGGLRVTFLIPSEAYGQFGKRGQLFRSFYNSQDEEPQAFFEGRWRELLNPLAGLALRDGDVVEFTTLETIGLFNSLNK